MQLNRTQGLLDWQRRASYLTGYSRNAQATVQGTRNRLFIILNSILTTFQITFWPCLTLIYAKHETRSNSPGYSTIDIVLTPFPTIQPGPNAQ